jgi:hypothetical protein
MGTLISNYKVEGLERVAVKDAGAGTEIGEGNALREPYYGVANFFHDTADGAAGFIGAGTLFVKPFAYTTDRRKGAFDVTNDFGEGDVFRLASELVAAGNPAATLDEASGFQVGQDLFQEALGNVLLFGNLRNADDATSVGQAEDEHGAKSILAFGGELHRL